MTQRRILGYRPHPAFKTLTQEIYECGHVRSAPTRELEHAQGQRRRCIKCTRGMPPDLSPEEMALLRPVQNDAPLLVRLCRVLAFHLNETETMRRQHGGELPEVDAAILEAHEALRQAGYRIQTAPRVERRERGAAEPPGAASRRRGAGGD